METRTEIEKKPNIISFLLIVLIKIYQFLTPWMNCCRFTPSCSQYAIEAIRKHGFFLGVMLSTYRILRCQPYCRGGYDPVPDKIRFKLKNK
ncbi:MAG: membrane protein insertion efficiency factor YidD [bacterium]|nr:membrane protein insertion efficiency factor YidD [bacterium]